jgi:metal-sulfur cluster biosynthetic enzyme
MSPEPAKSQITRETILSILDQVEHPEIACSLVELGMILDVSLKGKTARIAMSLPRQNIPADVLNAINNVITKALAGQGLDIRTEYFDMIPESRERFFNLARANWKGSI